MIKLYTEEQILKAIADACADAWDNSFKVDATKILNQLTPIELPSDEEIEKIAQWVIDNRYAKSELNKVSDFEMYHHIIKLIKEQILNQNKKTKNN